ncbi:hypothetical protein [Peterkaempfera sp. SMS 1(5)a]|uniref:hypothetical protein n=1 Tax=Peterkaempfera podocarpi TaxID=3232308 RepID=UPI00366ACE0B
MTGPRVRITVGRFNWADPREVETQVTVMVPGIVTSYFLPSGMERELRSMTWPEAVEAAHKDWVSRGVISTSSDQKSALAAWLAVDENRDALYGEWRADEIARHPIARELAAELERVRADRAGVLDEVITALDKRLLAIVLGPAPLSEYDAASVTGLCTAVGIVRGMGGKVTPTGGETTHLTNLGAFIHCSRPGCNRGEWEGKAVERGWESGPSGTDWLDPQCAANAADRRDYLARTAAEGGASA